MGLFDTLETGEVEVVKMFRVGKFNENPGSGAKPRPLKLVLKGQDEAVSVVKNAKKLKNAPTHLNNLSISHDLTKSEREIIKKNGCTVQREIDKLPKLGLQSGRPPMEADYCLLPQERGRCAQVNIACTLSGAAINEPTSLSRVFVLNSYIKKINEIPASTFSGASETISKLYHNSLSRIFKSAPSAERLVSKLCKSVTKNQIKYQIYKPEA